MSTVLVTSGSLGDANKALHLTAVAVVPLLAQVDLMLSGPFGLGAALADLSAQLSAAISVSASLSLNPALSLKAQLEALLAVQASISAALSAPSLSPAIQANLAANVAVSASLGLKTGGISALINAALSVKLPLAGLVANLPLGLGPCVVLSIGYAGLSTLHSSGTEYNALVSGGLAGIAPGDQVWGVVILTKAPAVSVGLAAIMTTS